MLGGLNSFYLLVDKPEVYGLPANPQLPSRNLPTSSFFSIVSAAVIGLLGLLSFRKQRMDRLAAEREVGDGRATTAAAGPEQEGGR
jgi:formate dehydrogenase iron-sulfur subunit